MMRLGLDARLLGPEQKGLGRYVEHALMSLALVEDIQPVVFCLPERLATVQHLVPNAEVVSADARWYTVREQLLLPLLLRRHRVDAMHYPHFNVPMFSRVPFIVTIHDLLLLEHSSARASLLGPARFHTKRIAWQAILRSALRRATRIITPSDSIVASIKRHYPWVASDRIIAVPLGADACESLDPAPEQMLAAHGVLGRFFLYVGNVYPHKNIAWLISNFQTYHFRHPETRLVLVGASDPFHAVLKEQTQQLGLSDAVIFWGTASDAELGLLYRSCAAYVFPSKSEGFGIPALEAMFAGALVICSDIPVLREILGDAPLYFSLNDASGILEAMERVESDISIVAMHRERGRLRARMYTWDAMHSKTKSIYQSFL